MAAAAEAVAEESEKGTARGSLGNSGPPSPRPARKQTLRWQKFVLAIVDRLGAKLLAMPRKDALRWGERLGRLAYAVAVKQKHFARRNLRLVDFPKGATDAERDALIRRVWVQFAKTAVELYRAPVTTNAEVESLLHVEGWEHLEAAIAKGKGVVFLSAHFGNWEIIARHAVAKGIPLTVVARDPEHPEFAARLRAIRDAEGYRILDKGSAVREILTVLKKGQAVAMLPDQNSGDVMVPFFGVPCGTPAGPAVFALRTGAPIVPCFGIRLPDDTYRVLVLPPIPVESTGDKDADTQRVMAAVNRVIEDVVRQYPDQWLWIHNRWKAAFDRHNLERAWPDGGDRSPAYRAALTLWKA